MSEHAAENDPLVQVREGLTRGPHLHYDGEHWVALRYVLDLLDRAEGRVIPPGSPHA